jgi:hypothetical protein
MLASFWTGVGDKLADRWVAAISPALLFWGGGLAAAGQVDYLATRFVAMAPGRGELPASVPYVHL